MEQVPLCYARALGHFRKVCGARGKTHGNCKTSLFWWKGSSFLEAIENVYYETPGEMNTTQAGWMDLMPNISRLSQEKRVYKKKRRESVFKFLIRSEENNTAWMKNIVQKPLKPENLVWDAFAGTFTATKACMLLTKHIKLIRCDVDSNCDTEAKPQLIFLYA